FKEMQWVKVPGTNRRLPRRRPASETMVRERPDLQIIELALWESVRARIAKGTAGRGRPRTKSCYLLSGILECAHCGMGMQICGTGPIYYRCPAQGKGLCTNTALLRTKLLLSDVFCEITTALRKTRLLREAIDVQNRQHDMLKDQM